MSDIFVPCLQYLGAQNEIAELDKGGAGQDKAFWEDIAIEFNDYSKGRIFGIISWLIAGY
jgi:hypothetical protein